MKVSLSLGKSASEDVAIMVDVLRASTTIIAALNNFDQIIPAKNIENAILLAKKHDATLAGERDGAHIEGFDAGNSPVEIKKFHGKVLVLTTSNGTRILEKIRSKTLIGSFVNAKAVAEAACEIADDHIEIVMAGVRGKFVIEDFLGAGEIISYLKDCKPDEWAFAAYMASHDDKMVNNAVWNSNTAFRLKKLGFSEDIRFSLRRNIYDHVPIYENREIKRLI